MPPMIMVFPGPTIRHQGPSHVGSVRLEGKKGKVISNKKGAPNRGEAQLEYWRHLNASPQVQFTTTW